MPDIRAYAAQEAAGPLERYDYDPGPLGDDRVEVAVDYCGICHSDLSMLQNDWGLTKYPFIPGHEAVGRITELGEHAAKMGLKKGQRVAVGWNAGSCMHCHQCIGGDQHLCPDVEMTIVGRPGAFADRVRAHWAWAFPLPDELDPADAGPMLCGGITVFAPLVIHGVEPTARVGVIGIGGLGHLALQFARAWGCEVTAFSSSEDKFDEAKKLGAHAVVNSRDEKQIKKVKGLDLLINTTNVDFDQDMLLGTLGPKGRLHQVGASETPLSFGAMSVIFGQKSVSGSPTGSPCVIADMLTFAARHGIAPMTEHFPMSKVNDAMDHLKNGKPRYRIVLDADFD